MSRDFDPNYVDAPGEYEPDIEPVIRPITDSMPKPPEPIKPAAGAFEWQKSRKRPDFIPGPPVRGFGKNGGYTLWLPSPKSSTAEAFEGGKYVVKVVAAGLVDADLLAKRKEIIDSAVSTGPGRLRVKPVFMDYAAGLIRRNYTVTDQELTMLLLESDKWQHEVLVHCLGGEEMVATLADMPEATEPIPQPPSYFDMAAEHLRRQAEAFPYAEPVKTGYFRRLFNAIRGK